MGNYTGLNTRLKVVSKPVASIDDNYGPYDNVEDALNSIPLALRAVGLTVGIQQNNNIVEYWFQDGITDSHLKEKKPFNTYFTNEYFDTYEDGLLVEKSSIHEIQNQDIIQLIDSYTKENVNYEETTTWYNGTPMDDSKVDNVIYRKKGDKYYVDCEYAARKVINIKRFGNLSNDPSINTLIIQKAVTVASRLSSFYGVNHIKPSPLPNYAVGYGVELQLPAGLYPINDRINFSYFTNITGNNSIIYQTDPTKDIFYSESPFENTFKGLIFIGGRNQITAQNGKSGVVGLEGVLVRIENCTFQANSGFSVVIETSGAGGGYQFFIKNVKWFEGKKFLYASCDKGSIKDSWLETSSTTQDDDTAWIENRTSLLLENVLFVPGGDYTHTTNRYVDNYASVDFNNCRLGAEGGGGLPFVYNYTDALSATTYPYLDGGSVIIRNCPNTCPGNVAKVDAAFVVIKTGLPNTIIIQDNYNTADPPFIRTGLFNNENFANFQEYFNRTVEGKHINIAIKHNAKRAPWNIVDANLDILKPFMSYTMTSPAGNNEWFNKIYAAELTVDRINSPLSVSHTINGSVLLLDTGIYKNTTRIGWGSCGVYSFAFRGNTNLNGSGLYKNAFYGILGVFIYHNGTATVHRLIYKPILNEAMSPWDGGITVTPVFWDGSVESDTINLTADAQIRIKLSPINGADAIEVMMNKIV